MNKHLVIRKTHRYLGLFIGIQFLGWTAGGLYFSWNNIDNVHGDHLRKNPHFISSSATLAPPDSVIHNLSLTNQVDSIQSIQLLSLVGKPLYQINYFSGHTGEVHLHGHYALADATSGAIRGPLTKEESIALAKDYIIPTASVADVQLIENTDGHHEYRERPLPAYAITFENPECTIYISTEQGTFQTIRHNQWRAFDFLYMLHTMDYESRDNFNNWLLRILSGFGLLTVLSGFLLFFISSRTLKKLTD